jgi:N-acetylated-alpha-linked acidic dipeptidase
MVEIAKQVIDPQTNVSVFERKRAYETISATGGDSRRKSWDQKDLKLGAMGSGSDYSPFLQHAGIPSLNLGYSGEDESGSYHSIYDSYDLFKKFQDPGFKYGVVLAETAGHAVLRMADADVLPFDFKHLFKTIDAYSMELMMLLKTSRDGTELENEIINSGGYAVGEDPTKGFIVPHLKSEIPFLDFSPLQNALHELGMRTDSLNTIFQKNLRTNHVSEEFNQALYRAEQQLLNESGLPRRSWYKHILYAPGYYTGYGVKTLPGIREAIEQGNWKEAQTQIESDAKIIDGLVEYFKELSSSGN